MLEIVSYPTASQAEKLTAILERRRLEDYRSDS